MSTSIAQRELRNNNAGIMAAVAAGETFVVTRNGTPVAELRPLHEARRTFVPKRELRAAAGASGVGIDSRSFRSELDAVVDPDAS